MSTSVSTAALDDLRILASEHGLLKKTRDVPIPPDMATPDYDASAAELARLEQRERELSDRRASMHERMDVGLPSTEIPRSERQAVSDRLSLHRRIERQLSDERLELHRQIDLLRTFLLARDGESPKPPALAE